MVERNAENVTVPDLVGMPFPLAREIASAAGIALTGPDPDGPPIAALAWPGVFLITSQRPAAGTVVAQWDSVIVEIVELGPA